MKKYLYIVRLIVAVIVLILSILGVLGIFYPVKIFDIQFAPLLQRVFIDFSVVAAILLTIVVLTTLIFGRIYCSVLCPFGIFQDLIGLIRGETGEYRPNFPFKYFIAAITFGAVIGGSTLIIRYLEPYTYFGSALTLSVIGLIALIAVGVLALFKKRLFCTDICPVGAVLGLISKISLFKMHINSKECLSCGMCERNCPSGCINLSEDNIDNVTCVKCFKCMSQCPKEAISYGIKPKEELKFNIRRRDFIITSAAFVVFGGMVKAGMEIGKNAANKIKDIILPPGAVNENKMLNKCLNCNLCVKNCPNEILVKSDREFGAVHIDYAKGKGYCEYDCKKCSEVCPSGAIKRITIEEKQKTQIAMAVVNPDGCINCGSCERVCPVNAITIDEGQKAAVDASKCIGCGKCQMTCPKNTIEIFAVKEQKVL
jgi:ferredoxin-type protein NapF